MPEKIQNVKTLQDIDKITQENNLQDSVKVFQENWIEDYEGYEIISLKLYKDDTLQYSINIYQDIQRYECENQDKRSAPLTPKPR